MPQIGPMELIVVAVIALVVFGPRRLPEMARNVGKAMNEFKKQAADLKGQFDAADLLDEPVSANAPPGPGTVVPEPTGPVGATNVAPETATALGTIEVTREPATTGAAAEVIPEPVTSDGAVGVVPKTGPVVDESSTQPIQPSNR